MPAVNRSPISFGASCQRIPDSIVRREGATANAFDVLKTRSGTARCGAGRIGCLDGEPRRHGAFGSDLMSGGMEDQGLQIRCYLRRCSESPSRRR
jgi:hypothetical protein